MKHYLILFFALFTFTALLFAQEADNIDPSCAAPSKKVQKMLDNALNTKDPMASVTFFNKALAAEPELAAVYFTYGKYVYEAGLEYFKTETTPAKGERAFKKTEELMLKASEYCSDYHSDIYYILGVVNYAQEEVDNAIRYFKLFMDFKNPDVTKYSAAYLDQKKDVKEILAQFEEEKNLIQNEVPFKPVIVKQVSTVEDDEYFPMISPDNELMFFCRKGDRKNLGDNISNVLEEISFAKRISENNEFDKGKAIGAPFNDPSFSNYGASTVSVDNKEMIICACKKVKIEGQDYNNCDLYSTTYEKVGINADDYKWTALENLGAKINTPNGWEGQPSLSADGNTLYFATNRPTTRDNDIYVAHRNPDGSWGEAKALDEINTDGKDKSPFLHQDSETLYFVSSSTEERKGIGGLDIFYTRMDNGKWTKPKNIGFPINSKEDEIGLFVSIDGKLAYFSSQSGGNWNIYSFELYEEARPKKVAIVKGDLNDPDGNPVVDATIEVSYSNSTQVEKVKVNGNDGKYAVILKQDTPQDVMVSVKKDGAAFDSKYITKEEIKQSGIKFSTDLAVKELKVGESYTINDILYTTTSAELNERSKFILREFARYLKSNEKISILIQGHTDSDGDDAKNLELSDRRAKGVRDYLITQGIAEKRLQAKGFGETQPKVSNDSPENKALNRRTDFVILGM